MEIIKENFTPLYHVARLCRFFRNHTGIWAYIYVSINKYVSYIYFICKYISFKEWSNESIMGLIELILKKLPIVQSWEIFKSELKE